MPACSLKAMLLPLALTLGLSLLIPSIADAQKPSRKALVLEYTFDDGPVDSSGNGYNGTIQGSVQLTTAKSGNGLACDGNGGFLESPSWFAKLEDHFTIECWVCPAKTQRDYTNIYGGSTTDAQGFAFALQQVQQVGIRTNEYVFLMKSTSKEWMQSRPIKLAPEKWQHVAVIKNPTQVRIFIDGMLVESMPTPDPMALGSMTVRVGLGFEDARRSFTGLIDTFRIWNRELESSELEVLDVDRLAALTQWLKLEHKLQEPRQLVLGLESQLMPYVPASIERITLALELKDGLGTPQEIPPQVILDRRADYKTVLTLPSSMRAGYYALGYKVIMDTAPKDAIPATGRLSFVLDKPSSLSREETHMTLKTKEQLKRLELPLNGEWRIAADPENIGRQQQWWDKPTTETKAVRVPGIIQEAYPASHGVFWYYKDFEVPANIDGRSRFLLRFMSVDYLGEFWLNGHSVGSHEGVDGPFSMDVTAAIKPGMTNHLAVRVINPTHDPIDGLTLNQTPHRTKTLPYGIGFCYNYGGILDTVNLMLVPEIYIEDLYAKPDPKTGRIKLQIQLQSAARRKANVKLEFLVAPAVEGRTIDRIVREYNVTPGTTLVEAELNVPNPRLWELAEPNLYRVTARISTGVEASDERSVRCGFRDFRFEKGYFRLNGRRIYLRCTHTVNATPFGQQVPYDPELFQRDLVYMKTMGFNCIRFIMGGATQQQLDMCDELGLMVYDESYAAIAMENNPLMAERFDRSITQLIRRDRNHPSVVIWGLLNEAWNTPIFEHATGMLPLIRTLDDSRMIILNSGRLDVASPNSKTLAIGSLSNPGSQVWENLLGGIDPDAPQRKLNQPPMGFIDGVGDLHVYPEVPHTAEVIHLLRTMGFKNRHVFLAEYGIGSAMDLWRITRHFERLHQEGAEDAQYYREKLNLFLQDWEKWKLDECLAGPEEFFAQSLSRMAGQRTLGLNAIRSNPNTVGYSVTGMMDHVNCGEGLFTLFREPKPGTFDALFDGFAPLRLCLFAEPFSIYRGAKVRLEAVLANEDALTPGDYPVHLQVIGPGAKRVMDRMVTVTIPEVQGDEELPLAIPFFDEEVVIDGPEGKYRFVATFERGAAPTGGTTEFYVGDPDQMPPVKTPVVLWGEDPALTKWLNEHGIQTKTFSAASTGEREVILVSNQPPNPNDAKAWRELAERIAQGSTAIFLSPTVFQRDDNPLGWLPLKNKGGTVRVFSWLYLMDEIVREHPIFEGLPAGGLMDSTFYRDIIPATVYTGQDAPDEMVVCGIKASADYFSGTMLSVYKLGAGRFILNTLQITEQLGQHPAAERLLRNLLNYAAADTKEPVDKPLENREALIKEIGYD